MPDFSFLQDPISGKWVIRAPKRAKRPNEAKGTEPALCPFEDSKEEILFKLNDVCVIANKYPFAEVHEVIIHSSDHHKNFDEMPLNQVEDVLKVYRERFKQYKNKGQVYIFNNHGEKAGESLPHPHSQLVVVPREVDLEIPELNLRDEEIKELYNFNILCPSISQWPDEVWVAPKRKGKSFDEIDDGEIKDLAFILSRLIQIFDLRHNSEFPHNFYIYPGRDWYLRLIPRIKIIGGFEAGTTVFVNTQDPRETLSFIKEHFDSPDFEKIKSVHQADYGKSV